MRIKTETVALKDLQLNLFVRQALNQDHALFLAELVENGVELPPIRINRERVVIDGRHRIEAHDLNNHTEIEAEVVEVGNETELIEDGDVTERQVREIFSHIEQLQKRANRSVSDWKKRFDSANGKTARSS